MSNHLTKINSQQRADMIERGMNPINPEHVQRYLSGDRKGSMQENAERIQRLMGGKLNTSLGHGQERENFSYDIPEGRMDYTPDMETAVPRSNNQTDVRAQLQEDMQGYNNNNQYLSSGLMSIKESPQMQPQPQQGNVAAVAQKLMTEYFNAFIKSLQQPSTAANFAVYKALKTVLENEQKLKGRPQLTVFQESCRTVTADMYQQLKG